MFRTLLFTIVLNWVAFQSGFAEEARTISVTGGAQLKVDPDSAEIGLAVTIVDMDVLKAKKHVDAVMAKLLAVAKKMQIAPDDIRATALRVMPQYDYQNGNKLLGYETTRSLTLTLRDISKLDQLLDAVIEAGVNQVESIELKTSKETEFKEKALSMAIADAKERAAVIAREFDVELGPVQTIQADDRSISLSLSAPVEGLANGGSYHPGKIKVDAGIAAVFLLK